MFLLVVICLGMGAGVVYMKSSEDNEGPKITFEEGKDTNYTSDMTEEDLLKDVKAQDDRDGDVTESLTVETIYPKTGFCYLCCKGQKQQCNKKRIYHGSSGRQCRKSAAGTDR